MPMDLDAALDLFRRLETAETTHLAMLLDPDASWVKTVQHGNKTLAPYFDGDRPTFIDAPHRPRKADAAWFEAQRAADRTPRVVYAAQAATVDDETLALVYTGSAKHAELGMHVRYTVAEVGIGWRQSELKIVSRYARCGECATKMSLALRDDPAAEVGLEGCGVCARQGWRFANAGQAHHEPRPAGHVRKVVAPDDPLSRKLYDALA